MNTVKWLKKELMLLKEMGPGMWFSMKMIWMSLMKLGPSSASILLMVLWRNSNALFDHGYQQKEGIDFFETYAPVVQWTTVYPMLILENLHGLKSKQTDVTVTFLHATLGDYENSMQRCLLVSSSSSQMENSSIYVSRKLFISWVKVRVSSGNIWSRNLVTVTFLKLLLTSAASLVKRLMPAELLGKKWKVYCCSSYPVVKMLMKKFLEFTSSMILKLNSSIWWRKVWSNKWWKHLALMLELQTETSSLSKENLIWRSCLSWFQLHQWGWNACVSCWTHMS